MESSIILIAILFGIVALAIIFLVKSKNALRLHNALGDLKLKADECEDLEEVKKLYIELKELHKKCFHHYFYYKVVEIKAILETKAKYLKKDEQNKNLS